MHSMHRGGCKILQRAVGVCVGVCVCGCVGGGGGGGVGEWLGGWGGLQASNGTGH